MDIRCNFFPVWSPLVQLQILQVSRELLKELYANSQLYLVGKNLTRKLLGKGIFAVFFLSFFF